MGVLAFLDGPVIHDDPLGHPDGNFLAREDYDIAHLPHRRHLRFLGLQAGHLCLEASRVRPAAVEPALRDCQLSFDPNGRELGPVTGKSSTLAQHKATLNLTRDALGDVSGNRADNAREAAMLLRDGDVQGQGHQAQRNPVKSFSEAMFLLLDVFAS